MSPDFEALVLEGEVRRLADALSGDRLLDALERRKRQSTTPAPVPTPGGPL